MPEHGGVQGLGRGHQPLPSPQPLSPERSERRPWPVLSSDHGPCRQSSTDRVPGQRTFSASLSPGFSHLIRSHLPQAQD